MDATELSASQAVVLRDLDGAAGRDVVKAVVAELHAAGCWTLTERDGHAALRQGSAAVPARPVCRRVAELIERTRPMPGAEHEERRVRDVGRKAAELEWRIVNDVLDELIALGLVEVKDGLFRRRRHVRTARGKDVLAAHRGAADAHVMAAAVPVYPLVDGGQVTTRSNEDKGDAFQEFDAGYHDGGGGHGGSGGSGGSGGGWDSGGGGGDSGGGGGCGSGGGP